VLTLWTMVVAERLGHPRKTAATLGRAVAGSSARIKARSLGIEDEATREEDRPPCQKAGEGRDRPPSRPRHLDEGTGPAEHITSERLGEYLLHSRGSLGASTLRQLTVEMAAALAAMVPARSWAWVRSHPACPTAREARVARQAAAPPPDGAVLVAAALEMCAAALVRVHELRNKGQEEGCRLRV
jgi:hypothetical protein